MPFEPRHPDEPALHHQLRDALNAGLQNTNFFVWIDVWPSGEAKTFQALETVVEKAERWLSSLDPDVASGDPDLPEWRYDDLAGRVRLHALPKKPEARGARAGEIVGNPEPIVTGFA